MHMGRTVTMPEPMRSGFDPQRGERHERRRRHASWRSRSKEHHRARREVRAGLDRGARHLAGVTEGDADAASTLHHVLHRAWRRPSDRGDPGAARAVPEISLSSPTAGRPAAEAKDPKPLPHDGADALSLAPE